MKHDTLLLLLNTQLQTYAWLYFLPTDAFLSNTVVPQKKFHLEIKSSGGPGGTELGLVRGQLF